MTKAKREDPIAERKPKSDEARAIGFISGRGESEESLGKLVVLIKALRKRFKEGIKIREVRAGAYELYGLPLPAELYGDMRRCKAVISGDFRDAGGKVEYSDEDIAALVGADAQYAYIQGFGESSRIDVKIVSCFDKGTVKQTVSRYDTIKSEIRTYDTHAMTRIVRSTVAESQVRGRRIVFAADNEYESRSKLFLREFLSCTRPRENVSFNIMTVSELCCAVLQRPTDFDLIFASRTAADALTGIYKYIAGDNLACFKSFDGFIPVYFAPSPGSTSDENNIPPLLNHIMLLAEVFDSELLMHKQAYVLRRAAQRAKANGFTIEKADEFIRAMTDDFAEKIPTKLTDGRRVLPMI